MNDKKKMEISLYREELVLTRKSNLQVLVELYSLALIGVESPQPVPLEDGVEDERPIYVVDTKTLTFVLVVTGWSFWPIRKHLHSSVILY